MLPVQLEARAREDIRAVYKHYKQIRPQLGLQFLTRLRAALALIQIHPEAFSAREYGMRRVLMRQFPFHVFYVLAFESIRVFAVMHSHADPEAWKKHLGLEAGDEE